MDIGFLFHKLLFTSDYLTFPYTKCFHCIQSPCNPSEITQSLTNSLNIPDHLFSGLFLLIRFALLYTFLTYLSYSLHSSGSYHFQILPSVSLSSYFLPCFTFSSFIVFPLNSNYMQGDISPTIILNLPSPIYTWASHQYISIMTSAA